MMKHLSPRAICSTAAVVAVTAAGLTAAGTAQGEHVVTILELLNQRLGAGLTVDGVFGPATQTAVRAFQARYKISVDGIVGVMMWNALVVHEG